MHIDHNHIPSSDISYKVRFSGADREGGLWGCNPPKEKQRKAAAQCKRARILRASAAAWYRRASFYVVVL